MARLDPVRYTSPKSGTFDVVTTEKHDGQWVELTRRVEVMFYDHDPDPFIELRVAFASSQPGVDPASVLY
jgi:hypothetical protein